MRASLQTVKRRVEALDRGVGALCAGPHAFFRVDCVVDEAAIPPWPDAEGADVCACGRPMKYSRVVSFIPPASGAAVSSWVYPLGL